MSLTFNLTGGGSNYSPGVALIRAITTTGATVVMTRGGVTKTSHAYPSTEQEGNSEYCFTLTSGELGGTAWTVSATYGGQTEAKTITVTEPGSYVLNFATVLYDAGEKYTAITGGYSIFRPDTVTIGEHGSNPYGGTDGATSMTIYVSRTGKEQGVNCAFGTVSVLDLSNYTTLHITTTRASMTGGSVYSFKKFGITPTLDTAAKSASPSANLVVGENTLDISSVTSGHVFFGYWAINNENETGSVDIEVTKIWLT